MLLPIVDTALKILLLILEGQSPQQRVKLWDLFITGLERVNADLSPEARAKAWSWLIAFIEQWSAQLKSDPVVKAGSEPK